MTFSILAGAVDGLSGTPAWAMLAYLAAGVFLHPCIAWAFQPCHQPCGQPQWHDRHGHCRGHNAGHA